MLFVSILLVRAALKRCSNGEINMAVAGPWATDTQLFSEIRDEWNRKDMPMNTALDVAKYIIQATADEKTHGKALYVAGGNAVDIEEGIWRLEPQWLGEKNSRDLKAGQVIMGVVSFVSPVTGLMFCGGAVLVPLVIILC